MKFIAAVLFGLICFEAQAQSFLRRDDVHPSVTYVDSLGTGTEDDKTLHQYIPQIDAWISAEKYDFDPITKQWTLTSRDVYSFDANTGVAYVANYYGTSPVPAMCTMYEFDSLNRVKTIYLSHTTGNCEISRMSNATVHTFVGDTKVIERVDHFNAPTPGTFDWLNPSSTTITTYSATGQVLKTDTQSNHGGSRFVSVTTYTYGAHGLLEEMETTNQAGSSPVVVYLYQYTYTQDDEVSEIRSTTFENGVYKPYSYSRMTYDAANLTKKSEQFDPGATAPDYVITSFYDAQGLKTKYEMDFHGFKFTYRFEY